MVSASTIINSKSHCYHPPKPKLEEVDYAFKFYVPQSKIATVTGTRFEDIKARFCLYRQHSILCSDCGDSEIRYTQVIEDGKPRCIGCDGINMMSTEMDVHNTGWYVLLPHVCDDLQIMDTCPMTFHVEYRNRS